MNKLSKENLTIASKHLFNTTNIDKKSEYMHVRMLLFQVLFSYGRKSFLGHDTYERQTKMLVKKSVKMGHLKSLGSEKSRVVHQNNLSVLMFYKDKLVSGSE